MSRLSRPLTAVEVDARLAQRLTQRLPQHVQVITGDFLEYQLPREPHVLVGNLPFHLTTAIMRRILHAPGWTDAILLTQWEVARRRASIGGATMMTSQWAPWFEFTVHGRVPAQAFTPRPAVNGGILKIHRREHPALPSRQRPGFQAMVHRVFTGPGRDLAHVLSRTTPIGTPRQASTWLSAHGVSTGALPKDLQLEAWVDLFKTSGTSPPQSGRTGPRRRSRNPSVRPLRDGCR